MRYEVRYPAGINAEARVNYLLPDGDRISEIVQAPWASDRLIFKRGAKLGISAEGPSNPKGNLQCSVILLSVNLDYGSAGPTGCSIERRVP